LTASGASINDGNNGANYTISYATASGSIAARGVTVSAVSATKTYDGNTTSTGTPTGGDLLTGDTYTSTGTQVFDSKNAGPRTLTASGASINDGNNGANYTISYATASGSIAARGVTVSAVSATKAYDGTDASSVSPSGGTLQEGDTYTSTGTQVFDSKNAGPRTLTASGASINDGNNGANYTISYATASGSIAARGVTVSAVSATKTYDGNTTSTGTPTGGDLLTGDTYTSTGTQVFDSKNAGPRTLTASGASINDGNNGANYTISYATASGSIAARGVTVSAVSATKTYDGNTTSTGTPTGGDLLTGDTYTSTGTQVFDSKNAGPRTLTASGASINDGNNGANYTISYATASGSIAARGVTVSAVSATKTYDGNTTSTGTPTGGDLLTGDTYTSTGTQVFDSKNAGPRTLTASGASINDGNNGANYTISYATASGSIAARGVTVLAVTDSKTYNGTTASAGTPTGATLQTGDTYTSTGTQVFDSKNAGPRTLTASGASINDGNNGANYTISYATASGTITQKALTVTANDQTKVYGTTYISQTMIIPY
jgi:hypothetical protein